jgi:hypothetical protein
MNATFSQRSLILSLVLVMSSSASVSDAARGPCLLSLYHYPSRVFSFTSHAHVVVAPYVLHPPSCTCVSSSVQVTPFFLPQLYDRVYYYCLEEVYTIPPLVVCLSFFLFFLSLFLFFFCRLGGIIVISGVRICKVGISIVHYTRVGLQNAWVKEHRGMLAFVI